MHWRSPAPAPTSVQTGPPAEDPRLTYATPFKNVRPDVKYVGDAACADCHAGLVESYRRHPMGRSLGPIASVARQQRYDKESSNPFEAGGLVFRVEPRGDHVVHREFFPDAQGKPVVEAEDEVQYVIGSGTRNFSYLSERDGCLFESPITWYTQKNRWALSPGYDTSIGHFEREVKPNCLFCHCNAFSPVADSVNRYVAPTFRGMTIGCERCHGPGELHVRGHQGDEPPTGRGDDTIVNPKRLEPALRDAVCEQCHLQGVTRLLRRGRDVLDYRPGLPLHLFWTIYVKADASREDLQFVSHVEQLQSSRCATASHGALGCTTCHDPHTYPPLAERDKLYRDACLKCHERDGCSLPVAERKPKNDSCVACHMQRAPSADVDHTVITDHRIMRRPTRNVQAPAKHLPAGAIPIVSFHRHLGGLSELEQHYDLGQALHTLPTVKVGLSEIELVALAKPYVEEALRLWPDDVPAREAWAYTLEIDGQPAEALAQTEVVLARAPAREVSLLQAAKFSEALGLTDAALAYCRRALAINSTSYRTHLEMARLAYRRHDLAQTAVECRAVLRYNSTHVKTRTLLVAALAQSGDRAQARAEFAKIEAQKPPELEQLRAAFRDLLR
jgi:hypothetical protein